MKVKNNGSNVTEVKTEKATILISYSTPVACCMDDGIGFFRTNKKWSKTTSKHINKWLGGVEAAERDQTFFDNLI